MSSYFISDLHLSPARPATTRALAEFLESHSHCQQLFILGDLFDAWPGDDDDSPLALDVAGMLREFSDAGPQVFLMRGNRDFLLGDTFCRAAGATLVPDPLTIELSGTPTLLMHGDSLCTDDVDYQRFRNMVREPAWEAELLSKPLAERRALASQLRAMSRDATHYKGEHIMDVTPAAVEAAMLEHGVRRLIHGHTHRPGQHRLEQGVRWVLGAWEESGWAIEAKSENLNLYNFVIKQ